MKVAGVIGATGFVGSNIVLHLLNNGYHVKCATRDPERAAWLKGLTKDASEKVSLHKVMLGTTVGPDESTMLQELAKDCRAVFFAAGFETQAPATIDFMVHNALGCLAAAAHTGVEVVVLTSSGGSTNPPGLNNETPKQEHVHWSDPDDQVARQRYSPAAKTLMELRALEAVGRDQSNAIVDEAKANNQGCSPRLCILNPNLILGPQLQPGAVSGNSLPWMAKILKGESSMAKQIPNDSMSIIDVRDLAALHVAAAENPEASGRYFGVDRSFPWEDIFQAMKRAYPPLQIPPRFEGPANTPTQFDHTRKESLGVKLRSLDEVMADLVSFMKSREVIDP